jgi:hypothetical protein
MYGEKRRATMIRNLLQHSIRRSAYLPGDWRKQIAPSVRVVGLLESLRKQRNCPGKANRA